jgi:RNA polymerase sigma factor (sigma-70 family)
MNPVEDRFADASTFSSSSRLGDAAQRPLSSDFAVCRRQSARTPSPSEDWDRRSERWGRLMAAAQTGDRQSYEQLLRELDAWLGRYFARRLPPPAAEDARQEALLAIHAKRHTYAPSRAFGAWVTAIARYKWIDRLRDASRFRALPLDDEIPVEDHGGAAISAAAMDNLLGRLKPAQASVIRLVKLQGLSIKRAAGATGQSAALVKINIHRGLKKLASLVAGDDIAPKTSGHCSGPANEPHH